MLFYFMLKVLSFTHSHVVPNDWNKKEDVSQNVKAALFHHLHKQKLHRSTKVGRLSDPHHN